MKKLLLFVCMSALLVGCPEKKEVPEAETPDDPSASKVEVTPKKEEVKKVEKKVEIDKDATKGTGYYITYPKDWELKPKYMGTDTMALSAQESGADTFRENVNVVSESTGSFVTAKAYKDMSMPMMQKMLTKFKVESEKPIKTKNGMAGHEMVYQHSMGQLDIKVKATFFTKGSTGYVVTCSADPKAYGKFEKQFDEITKSFVIQ